ncbi:MAG TPA: hypothetical protein VF556_14390 [Pyrinomonadaceae bacterium]
MKTRKSFLIRWLRAADNQQQEHFVLDIEHIQSGEKVRAYSFEQAHEWMKSSGDNQFILESDEKS